MEQVQSQDAISGDISFPPPPASFIPQQQQSTMATDSPPSNLGDQYSSLNDVAQVTPDDHYAKHNPGAGWAGYKSPKFGGYLDGLSRTDWE